MQPERIKTLIEGGLEGAQAFVDGDGRHFQALVICEAFAGKRAVQQQQMVYRALGDEMRDEAIHALSLRTLTPEEYAQQGH